MAILYSLFFILIQWPEPNQLDIDPNQLDIDRFSLVRICWKTI